MSFLNVYIESAEYTRQAKNYLLESITHTLLDSEYIYLGYKKPINAVYVGLATANTNAGALTVEYYNGSAYTSVSNLVDDSNAFNSSGFISWGRNNNDETVTTVEGVEKYWIRISISASSSEMVFKGINLLLSDDTMIQENEPALVGTDFYPTGETSFIGFHQASRNHIIQRLRNEGKGTYTLVDSTQIGFNDLNVFDLLDFTQLSQAACYLTIAKIYNEISDAIDDKYRQKYEDYMDMFNKAYDVFYLSLDLNDDGKQSQEEKRSYETKFIGRA